MRNPNRQHTVVLGRQRGWRAWPRGYHRPLGAEPSFVDNGSDHLRAVRRGPAQRHQSGLGAQPQRVGAQRQRVGEQLSERLRVPTPEPADRHGVRCLLRGQEPESDIVMAAPPQRPGASSLEIGGRSPRSSGPARSRRPRLPRSDRRYGCWSEGDQRQGALSTGTAEVFLDLRLHHGLDDQPGAEPGDLLEGDSEVDPLHEQASMSRRIFSVGDTRTDTGVGPSSRAWRLSRRNLRPSSFTPQAGTRPRGGANS
jgi:hypothetical protein